MVFTTAGGFSVSRMPPASSIFAAYASITAFLMLIQTMLNQFVPRGVQQYVANAIQRYFRPRGNNATIVIEERDGMSINEVYGAAETYLCTKIRHNIERLKIVKRHKDTDFTIRFAQCEMIPDFFQGIKLEWRFVHKENKKASKVMIDEDTDDVVQESSCKRYFELCFDKKHKGRVLDSYVPFILDRAKFIRSEKKVIKLHTLDSVSSYAASVVWESINLEHPSTFETLAMEPALKKAIVEDLDRFLRRKEFYRRVGKAWKRGYLLYGPPGTGKSSLIAAMANYLKFDIYDLELTNVRRDSDLRKLLLRTANRSILVIEDIDCTVELPDRNGPKPIGGQDKHSRPSRPPDQRFTLSGLLNFIDGLWSSCGDERIIIFTTNNKDKLDPALLRPGRMDMHIHMSYLTPAGFKLMASTYLNVDDQHLLVPDIQNLIQAMKVTPAEVAEELMKSDDADVSLDGLIGFLKTKQKEANANANAAIKKKAESKQDDEDEEMEERADATDIELVDTLTMEVSDW